MPPSTRSTHRTSAEVPQHCAAPPAHHGENPRAQTMVEGPTEWERKPKRVRRVHRNIEPLLTSHSGDPHDEASFRALSFRAGFLPYRWPL